MSLLRLCTDSSFTGIAFALSFSLVANDGEYMLLCIIMTNIIVVLLRGERKSVITLVWAQLPERIY